MEVFRAGGLHGQHSALGLDLTRDGRRLVVAGGFAGQTFVYDTGDASRGTVVSETTDDAFRFPTTAALVQGRLLVVNSQLDVPGTGGEPEPFTVTGIPAP